MWCTEVVLYCEASIQNCDWAEWRGERREESSDGVFILSVVRGCHTERHAGGGDMRESGMFRHDGRSPANGFR